MQDKILPIIHEHFFVPDEADLFFCTDLHGCWDQFKFLQQTMGFRNGIDYMVSTGDLGDRGDKSLNCFAPFIGKDQRYKSTMGNHDMFLATVDSRPDSVGNLLYNGGKWVFNDLGPDQLESFAETINEKFPIFLTVHHRGKKYGVVHAEIPVEYGDTGMMFKQQNWFDVIDALYDKVNSTNLFSQVWRFIDPYIWGRDVITYALETQEKILPIEGVDYTIHGHTVIKNPTMVENRFYMDTGGYYNGALTMAKATDIGFDTLTTESGNPEGIWRQYT
ncbi:serine/threonine protein phosphatase [Pantoea phage vB_PagS_AAS21]|uniref:Serine/threonine protein phosphatase n=1 Tax=Pantoea phage vB_PagS_AAS21 TaxID=2575261 RepID=A0A4Y5P1N5_9CAUD|nr:serine/threonine protein phosphatase [Pantoea phage vB_PagS_AAS21]